MTVSARKPRHNLPHIRSRTCTASRAPIHTCACTYYTYRRNCVCISAKTRCVRRASSMASLRSRAKLRRDVSMTLRKFGIERSRAAHACSRLMLACVCICMCARTYKENAIIRVMPRLVQARIGDTWKY